MMGEPSAEAVDATPAAPPCPLEQLRRALDAVDRASVHAGRLELAQCAECWLFAKRAHDATAPARPQAALAPRTRKQTRDGARNLAVVRTARA